jgi:hypothetical protein
LKGGAFIREGAINRGNTVYPFPASRTICGISISGSQSHY